MSPGNCRAESGIDQRESSCASIEVRSMARRWLTRIVCAAKRLAIFLFHPRNDYRAQNDADIRRLRAELKRSSNHPASAVIVSSLAASSTQTRSGRMPVVSPNQPPQQQQTAGDKGDSANSSQQQQQQQQSVNVSTSESLSQCQSELKKLRTENCILRDANKQLEDKNQV